MTERSEQAYQATTRIPYLWFVRHAGGLPSLTPCMSDDRENKLIKGQNNPQINCLYIGCLGVTCKQRDIIGSVPFWMISLDQNIEFQTVWIPIRLN